VIEIRDLHVTYATQGFDVHAVDGVDLSIERGECIALAGESGSGKSSVALALVGLLPEPPSCRVAGSIRVDGREIVGANDAELCAVRGRDVGIVFQDPLSSLDPVVRVGDQVAEPLRIHARLEKRAAIARATELLARVGLDEPARCARAYPHELSGGMRQRAMIAAAIACKPKLLVLDEPTSALDAATQARILELLAGLRAELGMAVLFVTHDLLVANSAADRLAVMYCGRIVELGPCARVLARPAHPYTLGLLRSMPRDTPRGRELRAIRGAPPPPSEWPAGCRFRTRCDLARDACAVEPALVAIEGDHDTACFFASEVRAP
jgi:oligopeptide/dipeptide ABC transporter ATP-binding protein